MRSPIKQLFQKGVARTTFDLERYYTDLAYEAGACIMLVDRPILDGAVFAGVSVKKFCEEYVPEEVYGEKNIGPEHKRPEKVFDRYRAIIHISSAAVKSPEEYEKIKRRENPFNIDTAAEAREFDAKLLEVYSGHPRRIIIPADGSFERKARECCRLIESLLEENPPIPNSPPAEPVTRVIACS